MTNSYNPGKRYTWKPTDKFEITGHQFGTILNAFRDILTTPEAVRILMISRANDVIEDLMADNVEKGLITEVPVPKAQGETGKASLTVLKKES